jgi:hypothetical protein
MMDISQINMGYGPSFLVGARHPEKYEIQTGSSS